MTDDVSSPLSSYRAVLLDIDGTLVDSNYLHIQAWAQAFDAVRHPVPSWRIHRCIGMDSAKLLAELLGSEHDRLGDSAKKLHTDFYEPMSEQLRPLPGARELLAELNRRGFAVVLATSAPETELATLRAVLQVEDWVSVVTSAEDVEVAKPAPDIVGVAVERSGCGADQAVMIGDSVWDMKSATAAGVRSVGVRSGGIGAAELLEAGAAEVYADVAEFSGRLNSSLLYR